MTQSFFAYSLSCLIVVIIAQQDGVAQTKTASNTSAVAASRSVEKSLIQSMQGKWKVGWSNQGVDPEEGGRTVNFWKQVVDGTVVEVHQSRLRCKVGKHKGSAMLISTINGKKVDQYFKRESDDPPKMLIAFGEGNSGMLGVQMDGNKMTLRYPAGCCSRSGLVVHLKRVGSEDKSDSK